MKYLFLYNLERKSEFDEGVRRSKFKPKLTDSNKKDDTFFSLKDDVIFYQKSEKKDNERQNSQNQLPDYYDEVLQKIHYPIDSDIKDNNRHVGKELKDNKNEADHSKNNIRISRKRWPTTKRLDAIWKQMRRTSIAK